MGEGPDSSFPLFSVLISTGLLALENEHAKSRAEKPILILFCCKVPKNHNENKRLYKRQSKTPLITLNLPQTDGVLISTTFNAWNHMRWFWACFPQTSYTKTMTWCCEVLRIGIMVLQVLPLPGLFLPSDCPSSPMLQHMLVVALLCHDRSGTDPWEPYPKCTRPFCRQMSFPIHFTAPWSKQLGAGITTAHIWMSQSSLGARSIISTQILHWNSIPEIATSSVHTCLLSPLESTAFVGSLQTPFFAVGVISEANSAISVLLQAVIFLFCCRSIFELARRWMFQRTDNLLFVLF